MRLSPALNPLNKISKGLAGFTARSLAVLAAPVGFMLDLSRYRFPIFRISFSNDRHRFHSITALLRAGSLEYLSRDKKPLIQGHVALEK